MSEQNLRPELDDHGEPEESQFDEEALRARRRQYGLTAAAIAIVGVAILAIPWRDHVRASGRIAPQRWARVHSEAPGVVREVTHTPGDTIEQGEVIAVLDYDEQSDALESARLALAREREKLADLQLRLRENAIQREGADAVAKSAADQAVAASRVQGRGSIPESARFHGALFRAGRRGCRSTRQGRRLRRWQAVQVRA